MFLNAAVSSGKPTSYNRGLNRDTHTHIVESIMGFSFLVDKEDRFFVDRAETEGMNGKCHVYVS